MELVNVGESLTTGLVHFVDRVLQDGEDWTSTIQPAKWDWRWGDRSSRNGILHFLAIDRGNSWDAMEIWTGKTSIVEATQMGFAYEIVQIQTAVEMEPAKEHAVHSGPAGFKPFAIPTWQKKLQSMQRSMTFKDHFT